MAVCSTLSGSFAGVRGEGPEADDFLALLEPDERESLEAGGRRRSFDRGEALLVEGTPGDQVLVLLGGRVKASCATPEGKEMVLGFCGPGDVLGELSALDDEPRSSTVTALEEVEALTVPRSHFRAFLDTHPRVAILLIRMLSRRFRGADRKRIEFGGSKTLGRVAARLVELAERYGKPEEGRLVIDLPVSQDELAGWCGASREATAGALQTLRELGLVETERRRITVLDVDAMRRHAA
jgi:CRP/FNR family transcriptional regulator, cyclic AMP receptor protein